MLALLKIRIGVFWSSTGFVPALRGTSGRDQHMPVPAQVLTDLHIDDLPVAHLLEDRRCAVECGDLDLPVALARDR